MGKTSPKRTGLSRDVREEESAFQRKKHGGWGQEPVRGPGEGMRTPKQKMGPYD